MIRLHQLIDAIPVDSQSRVFEAQTQVASKRAQKSDQHDRVSLGQVATSNPVYDNPKRPSQAQNAAQAFKTLGESELQRHTPGEHSRSRRASDVFLAVAEHSQPFKSTIDTYA